MYTYIRQVLRPFTNKTESIFCREERPVFFYNKNMQYVAISCSTLNQASVAESKRVAIHHCRAYAPVLISHTEERLNKAIWTILAVFEKRELLCISDAMESTGNELRHIFLARDRKEIIAAFGKAIPNQSRAEGT